VIHEPADRRDLPATGDAGVDAALARLNEVDPDGPAPDALAVLADVHELLAQRLSAAAE
jgi:hypothetical protein